MIQNKFKFYRILLIINMEQHQEEQRFKKNVLAAKRIPGTQRFYCFLPLSNKQILVKVFLQNEIQQNFLLIKEIYLSNDFSSRSCSINNM